MKTLTTTQAAHLAGVDLKYFTEWARRRELRPLHRIRIGRSFVTVWSYDALIETASRLTNTST